MPIPRSTYSVTEQGEFLCLVDSGKGRSITNDAEAVIADLAAAGHDLARKRVLYRDTMGIWDEMVVKDGQFSHFRPIRETDMHRAITKARSAEASDEADLGAAIFAGADPQKDHPQTQTENLQQRMQQESKSKGMKR